VTRSLDLLHPTSRSTVKQANLRMNVPPGAT
jgi:hypothetical protein